MGELILNDILVIVIIAIPVVLIAHRLNLPPIVGFLLTGIIIGPEGIGFVRDAQRIELLAEVGVALLLFHIGLEFSVSNLRGLKRIVLGGGLLQVSFTIIAGTFFGVLLGWHLTRSIFFGCAAALSSTAITLSFLSHRRRLDSPAGRITTGILILQDLAIVPMLVFLPLIAATDLSAELNWTLLLPFLKIILVFGVLWIFYYYVLDLLLHQVARVGSKELFVIILIGMAIGFAWFTKQLGLSFALGAFLGGLMISATPFRFHALSEIAPFRALVSGVFFVSVGMLISPSFVINHLGQVTAIVLFIVVAKTLLTTASIMIFRYPLTIALVVGMLLGQMGEFSFVLMQAGFKSGIIKSELFNLLIAASGLSIVIAPIMMELSAYVCVIKDKFFSRLPQESPRAEPFQEPGSEELENHAIICGFGPLGETIGQLLEKSGMHYVVLELNPMTAKKLISAKKKAYVGDGASAELLSHSRIEKAKMLAIAVPDYINGLAIVRQARRLNSQITIVARSRYRDQVSDFYEVGADIVICEELEAGIEMGRHVLLQLGVEEETANQFISEIRSFGSADFF
ncbi:MAG: cation:proton antiporter [Pseudomonadota bacterium]